MKRVHRLSWAGAIILVVILEATAAVILQVSPIAAWLASLTAAGVGLLWIRLRRSIRAEFHPDKVSFYNARGKLYLEVTYEDIREVQLKTTSTDDTDYYLLTTKGHFRLPSTLEGSKKIIAFFEELANENQRKLGRKIEPQTFEWQKSGTRGVRRLVR